MASPFRGGELPARVASPVCSVDDDDSGSGSADQHFAQQSAEIRALNTVWRNVLATSQTALQDARRAGEAARARAERTAMRAEEDRAALVAALRAQRAVLRRWQGVARRALVRASLAEVGRADALRLLSREREAAHEEQERARQQQDRQADALLAETQRMDAMLRGLDFGSHPFWPPPRVDDGVG